MCNYHHYQFVEHFHRPRKNPLPISSPSPSPHPHCPWQLLFPVSLGLPILGILCKWNHIIHGLSCGISLSLYLATGRLVSVVSYEGIEVASLRKMIKTLEQTLLRKAVVLLFLSLSGWLLQTPRPPWDPASLKGQVNASEHMSVKGYGSSLCSRLKARAHH